MNNSTPGSIEDIERVIRAKLDEGQITPDDRDLIRTYLKAKSGTTGIERRLTVTFHLVKMRKYIGPYRENTIDDIIAGFAALKEDTNTHNGASGKYKSNTIRGYGVTLRDFYKWMAKKGIGKIGPQEIADIPLAPQILVTKKPTDIIRPEEFNRLLQACTHSRDRALLVCMYEGCLRLGEVLNLTWGDITDFEGVTSIHLEAEDTKSKAARTVPIITYRQYILAWKNDSRHTSARDRVFVPLRSGYQFKKGAVHFLLRELEKRSGIGKHLSPHILRHSGITALKRDSLDTVSLSMIAWGRPASKMLEVYCHLDSEDVIAAVKQIRGIAKKVKSEPENLPRTCQRCGVGGHAPSVKYCPECGNPLNEEGRKEKAEAYESAGEVRMEDLAELVKLAKSERFKRLVEEYG